MKKAGQFQRDRRKAIALAAGVLPAAGFFRTAIRRNPKSALAASLLTTEFLPARPG